MYNNLANNIKFHAVGDELEDDDFVNDDCTGQYESEEMVNENYAEESMWPFPDPNKNLDKYLSSCNTSYMDEFEKWWNTIQLNKKTIAHSEYNKLLKRSDIEKKRTLCK